MSLIRSTLGVFLVLPILLMSGPLIPYTRTVLSNSVPACEQARIFSAFSAIEGVGGMLGPVFGAIFSVLVKTSYPWLIFDIMAFMTAISFLMVLRVRISPSISHNLPQERFMQESRKSDGSLSFRHISVTSDDYKVCEDHVQSLLDGYTEHSERHTGSMVDDEWSPTS
jgi:MFS family permease